MIITCGQMPTYNMKSTHIRMATIRSIDYIIIFKQKQPNWSMTANLCSILHFYAKIIFQSTTVWHRWMHQVLCALRCLVRHLHTCTSASSCRTNLYLLRNQLVLIVHWGSCGSFVDGRRAHSILLNKNNISYTKHNLYFFIKGICFTK